MANPRQRNKARSHKSTKPSLNSKRRMHQKLRRAPPLHGPEVLQKGWDKKKTVFQNYAALGLLPSIPLPTGPSSSKSHRASLPFLPPHLRNRNDAFADESSVSGATSTAAAKGADSSSKPKASFGRIVRDEEGNVIDIIIDGEDDQQDEDGDAAMAQDDDEPESMPPVVEAKTDVVRSLEALSATSAPVVRHSSTSERTWLQQLVEKHGDDTANMARDRGLNVWQKTEGEIKRAIKKAGGRQKLLAA